MNKRPNIKKEDLYYIIRGTNSFTEEDNFIPYSRVLFIKRCFYENCSIFYEYNNENNNWENINSEKYSFMNKWRRGFYKRVGGVELFVCDENEFKKYLMIEALKK